jgi:elongation factor 1-gamma
MLHRLLVNCPVDDALQTHTFAEERQLRTLDTLNAHLSSRTFFVGERITLADIAVAVYVLRALPLTIDAQVRSKVSHVIRHFETIVNQPQLKEIFGSYEYIEKAAQYVPPPKEKKEPKPQAAAPPKAEKKPKAKEVEEEEEEELVPAEPKVKNPLDDLPKSNLNLEEWKRVYSNRDTRGADGAIEWFYKKYAFQAH